MAAQTEVLKRGNHPAKGSNTADETAKGVTRLVLVDDHELVRDGLKALIDAQPDLEVVGEAATAEEAVRRIRFEQPDVVVLDLDLPDGSGIDVCRQVQTLSPHSRVLILTAFADEKALIAARRAGASGFVLKRVHDFDLVAIIRRVAGGESAFNDAPDTEVVERPIDPLLARLTEREKTILFEIAKGKTNREIAGDLYLAEKTVKNYVSTLLMKMGIPNRAGAAAHLVRAEADAHHEYPPADWKVRR
ncbi:MAG TPA: response regulator transcription factor [Acidimicrobiia bacterium]|nr:response regulator transcription factor [Acidimicrobiia bacterium]